VTVSQAMSSFPVGPINILHIHIATREHHNEFYVSCDVEIFRVSISFLISKYP
jgi:hypothetical protein